MVPLLSLRAPASTLKPLFLFIPSLPFTRFNKLHLRRAGFPRKGSVSGKPFIRSPRQKYDAQSQQNEQPPRTLFPGGYKRPEIKVPNFVLQLEPEEVLSGGDANAFDLIDNALSKFVGVVVLNGGEGSGGRVYEAARMLKSVIRDRAYFLIAERVDIAAAVGASGVLLSDQGLPAIVARNTMMSSNSDSVVLPLVAMKVQNASAALNATNSEGADFLIFDVGVDEHVNTVFKNVKIPIFITNDSKGKTEGITKVSELLKSGASGLVISLEELGLFGDALSKLFDSVSATNEKPEDRLQSFSMLEMLDVNNDSYETKGVAGFVKLEDREKELIEKERSLLHEVINVIKKAAPLMEEVSLLIDAVSQIDEPFLLAIVGEFNSGKSTVINALLGKRYLTEGVVPTTNEITFLCYSKSEAGGQERCKRHPDGQLMCYLPAPILREMNIVDTPGTNVILQRQQRLTEEFVPRADLLIFVISADRPLTESEVNFLRYSQQWRKKVVFVLNKADLYQDSHELEEAISFIKENAKKLLNTEDVMLYPLSARSVLEERLSASSGLRKDNGELAVSGSNWRTNSFYEFESFLYSFLDGSTTMGMERVRLKLETPIAIAEQLLSACETLVRDECQSATEDLTSANEIVDGVKGYVTKMENESISWRRKIFSEIDSTRSNIVEVIESTLQLSNLDLVASYVFKGGNSAIMPATSRVQNDIIGPKLSDVQKVLREYLRWLESNNVHEGKLYMESFESKWPTLVHSDKSNHLETYDLLRKLGQFSLRVIENFSANAASKQFDQEIRQAFLGTFGGLGAAGLSASLLTSVLPTTLEDLLALGLCSAGGYIAISNFPARRQGMIDKVNRIADALAQELENAMEKDLTETVNNLENFVKTVGKPYQDAAQTRFLLSQRKTVRTNYLLV
ncbi:hypothetical protein SLE2022_207140 [Rubroshorea leprosula]